MIKYSSRLIIIYIFWYIIYLFLPLISPDTLGNIAQMGLSGTMHDWYTQYVDEASKRFVYSTIYGGYGYHLWFFHALLLGIVILAISIKYNILYYGFAFSIILYTMGLLIGPYKESFLGIPLDIDTRNGPFFSTIFVFIGASLYKHKINVPLRTALLTTAAGFIIVILEVYIIRKHYGIYRDYYDILIGTIPYATGVALIPICTKNIGVKFNINSLAKYSIGIYLVHLLVMKSLIAIGIWPNFAIIQIIFVLIGCIIFLRLFFMVPQLRRFAS